MLLAELFWKCFAGSGQYKIEPRMISGAFVRLEWKCAMRKSRCHWVIS
jgi:hypothetical protein